ncbi:MAG: hypothetical protein N2489_05150 [Clostridia bacterium]|nr:hypothetical protein [Clostridia bacterium]
MKSNLQRGSALPLVILVTAVLVILSVSLSNLVVQWYGITREDENHQYAYVAAESAIEHCFLHIYKQLKNPDFVRTVTPSPNYDAFADNFIGSLHTDIASGSPTHTFNVSGGALLIDVLGNGNNAEVDVDLKRVGSAAKDGNELVFDVGISAQATLKNGRFNSYGRKVFAKKQFRVTIAEKFFLNAPVYTIGNLLASDNSNLVIEGDVYVFGTFPERTRENRQDYYGGIMAASGSTLTISGSAFTYSFIRSGIYNGDPGGSSIYINGDAIAQSIQIFGKNNNIAVGRNAYTIDDLEVDGENSIIAVNGSYIGLSRGDDQTHDSSSAVVNAAVVHNGNSDEAKKSRIVVNGDVVINGTTFKVNPSTGAVEFKMESASLAWQGNTFGTGNPLYRSYSGLPEDYLKTYISSISNVKGFQNVFQHNWNPLVSFPAWLAEIRLSSLDVSNGTTYGGLTVRGFTNNCMAANGRSIYHVLKDNETASDVKRVNKITDTTAYKAPSLFETTNAAVKIIPDNFWADLSSCDWNNEYNSPAIADYTFAGKLNTFRTKAMQALKLFAYREFPLEDESAVAAIPSTMGGIQMPSPNFSVATEPKAYESRFLNILYSIKELVKNNNSNYVLKYDGPGPDIDLDADASSRYTSGGAIIPGEDQKLYLAYNTNPQRTIKINGFFKGMIVTAGRIELEPGADVHGVILAAGEGMNGGSASENGNLPYIRSNGSNHEKLYKKDYTAIMISGAGNNSKITYINAKALIEGFASASNGAINLSDVFEFKQ